MIVFTCEVCGKEFSASPAAKRKFCSRSCYAQSKNKRIKRICKTCGKEFLARSYKVKQGKALFCSVDCAYPNRNRTDPCTQCGKPVPRRAFHDKKFDHVFCSRTCYHEFRNSTLLPQRIEKTCPICGKHFSTKPSKDRIHCSQECFDQDRKAETIELVCDQCGKIFSLPKSWVNSNMFRGKYCSQECMGLARQLPNSIRSEYNHEFTEHLKESIRDRDNHTCQLCEVHESTHYRSLSVHHIDYDKENNDPTNLIALCSPCHSKTNYNRSFWKAKLTKTIAKKMQ